MLIIDQSGRVQNSKIKLAISPAIEHGEMNEIHGIIVHQTDSATAQSTLNGYKAPKPNGAHFLIDKDGTIYQTASVYKKTHHVGFIKSRCIAEHSCTPVELKALQGKRVGAQIGQVEKKKTFPKRYPFNNDSIGIENVSLAKNGVYESLTAQQQASLSWLINELTQTLKVPMTEIFRHSEVSWKLSSEGASAKW
jgi:N-acetyl-anhydromuramyl-L-alanine amidase AmpD